MTTKDELFAWIRSNQGKGYLVQPQVNSVDNLLIFKTPSEAMALIADLNEWELPKISVLLKPNPNPPRATRQQIIEAANDIGVEPAKIKALSDVESKGGYNKDGSPKILFERHKFYQALTKRHWYTKRDEMVEQYPDICNKDAGDYNARRQYEKLEIAATLNWDAAHEAASWGFGQVMGFNWEELGYDSIQDFITRMYASEGEQLLAVCRFIKNKGLDKALNKNDWAAFAYGYNGPKYRNNNYDNKMSAAYLKAKKEGW